MLSPLPHLVTWMLTVASYEAMKNAVKQNQSPNGVLLLFLCCMKLVMDLLTSSFYTYAHLLGIYLSTYVQRDDCFHFSITLLIKTQYNWYLREKISKMTFHIVELNSNTIRKSWRLFKKFKLRYVMNKDKKFAHKNRTSNLRSFRLFNSTFYFCPLHYSDFFNMDSYK